MTSQTRKLLDDAMTLAPQERADLAARLLNSLDEAVDADAQVAWDAEIQRRLAELDGGAAQPVPWAEARRRIEAARDDAGNS